MGSSEEDYAVVGFAKAKVEGTTAMALAPSTFASAELATA
jgi:hypothetical protein